MTYRTLHGSDCFQVRVVLPKKVSRQFEQIADRLGGYKMMSRLCMDISHTTWIIFVRFFFHALAVHAG